MIIIANRQLRWLFLSTLETSVLFVVPGSPACLAEKNICDKFHIQSKWALAQRRARDRLPVCDNGRIDLEPVNSTAGTDTRAHTHARTRTRALARDWSQCTYLKTNDRCDERVSEEWQKTPCTVRCCVISARVSQWEMIELIHSYWPVKGPAETIGPFIDWPSAFHRTQARG